MILFSESAWFGDLEALVGHAASIPIQTRGENQDLIKNLGNRSPTRGTMAVVVPPSPAFDRVISCYFLWRNYDNHTEMPSVCSPLRRIAISYVASKRTMIFLKIFDTRRGGLIDSNMWCTNGVKSRKIN